MDPIAMIAGARGSFFFQFGTDDFPVPTARAEEFFAAAPGPKKILFYEAGHGLNAQAVRDRVAWIKSGLGLRQ